MLTKMLQGHLPQDVAKLHAQYGSVVRTAPDELSFIDPRAWKDIYSSRSWERPPQWRGKPPGFDSENFISADGPTHAYQRRVFGPAFSDSAVSDYEPFVQQHITKLFEKLRGQDSPDMVKWLSFCFFDITMDIGWAKTFDLLEGNDYHPWIRATMSFKALLIGAAAQYYQPLPVLLGLMMPEKAKQSLEIVIGIARENVEQRLQMKTDRKDIFAHTIGTRSLEEAGVTKDEMTINSMNYTLAGGESAATVAVSALHNLMENLDAFKTLCAEVRSSFKTSDEITATALRQLPYLNAVIRETMRVCPTVPDGMRRQVPPHGAIVCGEALPGGTVVSFAPLAAYTNDNVFERALDFIPERWLAVPVAPKGKCAQDFKDKKDAFEPFSYGPRGCIGRTLAWMEMRIMVARLVWSFDISRPQGASGTDWKRQQVYWIWEKDPLPLTLIPRL